MIPLAGIAVLAAVAGAVSQGSVPRAVLNGDAIEVMLPANAFRNEQFLKYLASGLTTAIVVSTDDARGVVRIEIRYDLWDEIDRLTYRDWTGKREQLTLLPARLNEWLSTTHFRVASVRDGQAPAFLLSVWT